MPETDDVIDSIDALLDEEAYWRRWSEANWESEAMRWHDGLPEENADPFRPIREWQAVAVSDVLMVIDPFDYVAAFTEASRQLDQVFAQMTRAFRPFAEAMGKLIRQLAGNPTYDEHHPEPLMALGRPFGADYARRRKARQRRLR